MVEIELLGCKFVNQTIILNLLVHMREGCLESRFWTLIGRHRVRITKDITLERGASWFIGKERAVVRLSECSFDRFLTVASSLECCCGVLALRLIARIDNSTTWQECNNAIIMTPLRKLGHDLRQRLRRAKLTYASMELVARARQAGVDIKGANITNQPLLFQCSSNGLERVALTNRYRLGRGVGPVDRLQVLMIPPVCYCKDE